MEIDIRKLSVNEREGALTLVLSVFMQYEAPDYTEQGIESFVKSMKNKDFTNALEFYGAIQNQELIGVLATRNNGNHIALLFVKGEYHKQGIGRKLFKTVINLSTENKMTVNSSPYAIGFYRKVGFLPDRDEQVIDGIRFTPMTLYKK